MEQTPHRYRGCQLATDFSAWPKDVEQMALEPKYDGYRLTAIIGPPVPDGLPAVSFHCRSEKPADWSGNLQHIADELGLMGFHSCMLDGEVMADGAEGSFNATGMVRRKILRSSVEKAQIEERIKFHVFDMVDLSILEWRTPRRTQVLVDPTLFEDRRAQLAAKFVGRDPFSVKLAEMFLVESLEEALKITQRFMDAGGEGAMLKRLDHPYTMDRTTSWLKIKPFETFEAKITGTVEGTGKYVGMLGAIECVDAEGREISVGTGLVDAQRRDMWAVRDALVGQIVECKRQAGRSTVATARHPVFVRLRPDRTSL